MSFFSYSFVGWVDVRLVVGCWVLVVGCWLLVDLRVSQHAGVVDNIVIGTVRNKASGHGAG